MVIISGKSYLDISAGFSKRKYALVLIKFRYTPYPKMQENAEFIKMSRAGFAESQPHDVTLM